MPAFLTGNENFDSFSIGYGID